MKNLIEGFLFDFMVFVYGPKIIILKILKHFAGTFPQNKHTSI